MTQPGVCLPEATLLSNVGKWKALLNTPALLKSLVGGSGSLFLESFAAQYPFLP